MWILIKNTYVPSCLRTLLLLNVENLMRNYRNLPFPLLEFSHKEQNWLNLYFQETFLKLSQKKKKILPSSNLFCQERIALKLWDMEKEEEAGIWSWKSYIIHKQLHKLCLEEARSSMHGPSTESPVYTTADGG
jgi:hypothetical protein